MNLHSVRDRRTIITIYIIVASVALALAKPSDIHAAKAEENASGADAPPGSITFVGKNMFFTANGTFRRWRITKAELDLTALEKSQVTIEVDMTSIDTQIEKRDKHLRTDEFFDVKKYPVATLRIYDIAEVKRSAFGLLTCRAKLDWDMRGVQKTYEEFTFEVVSENPLRVRGEFEVNRMDFHIGVPYRKLNPLSIKEAIPIKFDATLPE